MPLPLRVTLAVSISVALWFALQMVISILNRRNATTVALAEALIEEQSRATKRPPLRARVANAAAARGWTGMLTPIVTAATFLWGVISLAGTLVTGNRLLSMFLALPATGAVVWMAGSVIAQKRKAAFDRQLLAVLNLVSEQLTSGGVPVNVSLQQVTAVVDEPMRSELRDALDEAAATKKLIPALRNLAARYPSRAFDLFLTALEIDEATGGAVAPALRQAADSLQKDFELAQEANAEIAQTRIEFVGILVIMGFIAMFMFTTSPAETRAAYATPFAMVVIGAALVNFAIGVLRATNMFRQASGQAPRKLDRVLRKRRQGAEEVSA